MTASTEDIAQDSIVDYQLALHTDLRRRQRRRKDFSLRQKYTRAQQTAQSLGLDPKGIPYPSMTNHLSFVQVEKMIGALEKEKEIPDTTTDDQVRKVYDDICKKDIPRAHKLLISHTAMKMAQHKKISTVCQRELKRALTKTSRTNPALKGKRITKELQLYFRRTERSNREKRRKEEKEDYERRKKEEEEKEEERQARKLDFLITQTELFSHFILGRKQEGGEHAAIAQLAAEKHRESVREFDGNTLKTRAAENQEKEAAPVTDGASVYNNSVLPISQTLKVPKILHCSLKDYQKRGLEWLVSLYNQGINGMLADEMGLGKTVQAISFLAHLAENEQIWGPFLVITPASTLHNWEQELKRFVPSFKVISYWGTVADRKMQRKAWQRRKLQRADSPFHVVVTSYQLAVTDEKYFTKIKWQYMVLDEAQAIKSSSSARWRTLLSFKARSRLLLTGTPIQNTLQELWALLHFIMPTLFDSHGEFSEWFKIEDGDSVNEAARLRMVLQPFMLRREKKDVADELGQKVEKTLICELSSKQKKLYEGIRLRAPMATFLDSTLPEDLEGVEGLMNLVMQFRKVCNHPDLFEKREARAGWCQPPNEVYIPQLVSATAFGSKRKIPDAFTVGQHVPEICQELKVHKKTTCGEQFGTGNSIGENEWEKQPRKKLRVERIVPPNILGHIQNAVIQPCLPVRQKIVSVAVVPEPEKNTDVMLEAEQVKVYVPSMERFVSDSGKLLVLDALLPQLKEEGHRVLMYFQMTRMIDLFEEYLTVRNYSYLRLDGSSKISSRKGLVQDWQSNSDKFIFLLSTRAGGLGINLTAADTVIFYDSDWNPTADQQAMDRAHRLGQTKQVTVYRLITAGTIEERIMERAGVKGEIQRMVIKTRD